MNFTWDPPTSIVRIFFIDILAVVRFLMRRYSVVRRVYEKQAPF
jgi:hypothetical protein